jgi:hypothetical protein
MFMVTYRSFSISQRANSGRTGQYRMHEEADKALVKGVRRCRYIERVLPNKDFVVQVDGEKLRPAQPFRLSTGIGAGSKLVSTIMIRAL